MEILKKNIILASKSPRRSHLLQEAGFSFTVRTREVDEIYPEELPVHDVAPYLAELKAEACADFLTTNDDTLLTADSVVILGDEIYGKPKDFDDAKMILSELSGRMHEVVTGVCLLSKNKKRVFSSSVSGIK